MNTNYDKLFKLANNTIEITKNECLGDFNQNFATLKCGKYYIGLTINDLSHFLNKMSIRLRKKEVNLENYNNFLSLSLQNGLEYNSRIFNFSEIKASGALFMAGPTDLAFPFDDLDKKVDLIARTYSYDSFDEIRLNEYAYLYTISNRGEGEYRVRGVKKEVFNETMSSYLNHESYDN